MNPNRSVRIPNWPLASAFVLAVVLASSAEPQPAPLLSATLESSGTNAGPTIKFAEVLYDFGKADSGTLVKHEYIFTNIGSQTLVVSNVQPSCGCTTAGSWDKVVEPGKTGIIPIQFNSTGYGGAVAKSITVTCNDPTNGITVLQLKGTIWKPIDVNPGFAMFNISPDIQTNDTKVVRIVSNLEDPVTISEPTWSNTAFKAELKTIKEGTEFELQVTVLPPLTNTISAPITMKTSSPKMPVLTVTAYAMVQPAITLNPPQITLPGGPLASVAKPTVTIQNNSTNALVLSEPSVSAEGAEVQLKEVQSNRMFSLSLNFPAGFQIQPGHTVEATVKSSNPKVPLIKIPIYQLPPPAPVVPPAAPAAPLKSASAPAATTLPSQSVASSSESAPAKPAPAPAPK
jgi:hypothetical protein